MGQDVWLIMVDVESLFLSGKNECFELKQGGDFLSDEVQTLVDEADIIVGNPPFSRFREIVAKLVEKNKKFLLIGNMNAVTYKDIFSLISSNQLWISHIGFGDMSFKVPVSSEPRKTRYWVDDTGQKWRSLGNAAWFTNLDHIKRQKPLILVKQYSPKDYPKYDNYDAIECSKTKNIPIDYDGIIGVPITALYNLPECFEIVGSSQAFDKHHVDFFHKPKTTYNPVLNGKNLFKRIFVRNTSFDLDCFKND